MWKQTTCFEMGPGQVKMITQKTLSNTRSTHTRASFTQLPKATYELATHLTRLFVSFVFLPAMHQVCNPVTQAQQNYVITVPLADGTDAYIWTGDKWQQAPNQKYDEQPQTWLPLEFDGDTLLPFKYVDTFTLDVAE